MFFKKIKEKQLEAKKIEYQLRYSDLGNKKDQEKLSIQDLMQLSRWFPYSVISNGYFYFHKDLPNAKLNTSKFLTKEDVKVHLYLACYIAYPRYEDYAQYIQAGINNYLKTSFSKDELIAIGIVCNQPFGGKAAALKCIRSDYCLRDIYVKYNELLEMAKQKEQKTDENTKEDI